MSSYFGCRNPTSRIPRVPIPGALVVTYQVGRGRFLNLAIGMPGNESADQIVVTCSNYIDCWGSACNMSCTVHSSCGTRGTLHHGLGRYVGYRNPALYFGAPSKNGMILAGPAEASNGKSYRWALKIPVNRQAPMPVWIVHDSQPWPGLALTRAQFYAQKTTRRQHGAFEHKSWTRSKPFEMIGDQLWRAIVSKWSQAPLPVTHQPR